MSMHTALMGLLPRLGSGANGIEGLVRLTGGATQEIWRFDIVHPHGRTPLILRRAPDGAPASAFGVGLEVEAQLMGAAGSAGVPVPPIMYVLAPEDGLGQGFIMGFVEGETLGGRIVRSDALAAARTTLAWRCGEVLARVHAIDVGQFASLPRATPAELLAEWRHAYEASGVARPVFAAAFRWLACTCPAPPAAPRLVHGDFRNGNLMVGPDGLRAVLDWELAHIGDPMEDLGWICVNSWRFGEIGKPVGGFGDRADLWAGYAAGGGAALDRGAWHWWEMFGTLRWGVICAGALAAFRGGERSVERAMIARRSSETEIDLLRLLPRGASALGV